MILHGDICFLRGWYQSKHGLTNVNLYLHTSNCLSQRRFENFKYDVIVKPKLITIVFQNIDRLFQRIELSDTL